ncbi:MAG TPA: sigma-70 family RNA polymerase sigma factor [Gemmatimonadaceae bacterium]|jgi:RNA polymerase sigma-70 factor (ECF subfamily)|nr:sigma-70 family RNA polymerase sigma factor [Gemmatimonadaceae bacterium]
MPIRTATTPDDESQLLARLGDDDEDTANRAIAEIIARYQVLVEQIAWRIVRDRDAVLDIAQHVWCACWETRRTLVVRAGLREYLICAARTRASNWHRGERRHQSLIQKIADWCVADEEDIVENDAIHQLAADDHDYTVRAAVAALPPRCREVYECVTRDDYTHDEVAKLLGMSRRTVGNHMWHANQAIHRALTQSESAAQAC